MDRKQNVREVPIQMGPVCRFPYLVVRLIPTLYQHEKIFVGPTPPKNATPRNIVVVHPDPWDGDRLRPEVRQEIIEKAIALCVRVKRFRMCVVFGEDDQVYVDPDGTTKEMSNAIPRAWIQIPLDRDGRSQCSLKVGKTFEIPAVSLQPETLPSGQVIFPARERRRGSRRAGKAVAKQDRPPRQEN